MHSRVVERFLRYVQIDTTSDALSSSTPSTAGQWELARMLADELRSLGVSDVTLTDHSYVIARIPASRPEAGDAPVVALFSHLDTASDAPGRDIRPQIHTNYDGSRITLSGDPLVTLDPSEDSELKAAVGKTIITSDGTTLLGADDKAGIAVIVTAVERLLADRSLLCGPLCIVFNPDEEIARGVEKLDLGMLNASVAYTLDAGKPNIVSFETFSADKAEIVIEGRSEHPGTARGRMINAMVLAAKLISLLPRETLAPESTDGRQGFLHPRVISGTAERVSIEILLRDFEDEKLDQFAAMLQQVCTAVESTAGGAKISCVITPQYRNMRKVIERDMRAVDFARDAVRALGLVPADTPVRGGTDGSVLSARGLPTPNLGRGGHNAHSVREWVAAEEMEISVEVVLRLLDRWARERH